MYRLIATYYIEKLKTSRDQKSCELGKILLFRSFTILLAITPNSVKARYKILWDLLLGLVKKVFLYNECKIPPFCFLLELNL